MKTTNITDVLKFIAIRLGRSPDFVQCTGTEENNDLDVISLCYDRARRKLLSSHDWSFATKTTGIQWDQTQGAYMMPGDCIRILCIGGRSDGFRIEERKIIMGENGCNCDCDPCQCGPSTCCPLRIRYIFDQTNDGYFSEEFLEAVVRMAASFAGKVIEGSAMLEDKERIYAEKSLRSARALQNQEAGGVKVTQLKNRYGCGC